MKINAQEVTQLFYHCLYTQEEVAEGIHIRPPGAITVKGISFIVGFNPERLEEARDQVWTWLMALPTMYRQSVGIGWTIMNAGLEADGTQWTTKLLVAEQLFLLAVGLNLATCTFARELWADLPGKLPYYMVNDVPQIEQTHGPLDEGVEISCNGTNIP